MSRASTVAQHTPALHAFARTVIAALVPGPGPEPVQTFLLHLGEAFQRLGHVVLTEPTDDTDLLITTAPFGVALDWREALLFTARRRFDLKTLPTLVTAITVDPDTLHARLDHFANALAKPSPDPADFSFPGLAPDAWKVLLEQGLRGGPMLSLERLVQSQAKSIRALLVAGEGAERLAYHFDLVGAHPQSRATAGLDAFYDDIARRLAVTVSTHEVSHHKRLPDALPAEVWVTDPTVPAMCRAGHELGKREFFTNMILIKDLVNVPAVSNAVAKQYSEGCFATWSVVMDGLVVTATGSARPVDKGHIGPDDLALVVGVRPDGQGAIVRPIEGQEVVMPSSEGFEMVDLDRNLPTMTLGDEFRHAGAVVPVTRSKLHGHRGVGSYDPRYVEYTPLSEPYFYYLVSCATAAQAQGISEAFARSQALNHPDDPRRVAFTILPGHGTVIVEKWAAGREPLQLIWEYMDAGYIQITNDIPQGPITFQPGAQGRMVARQI